MEGLEPTRREALDPKSSMSTNFITSAGKELFFSGCKDNAFFHIRNDSFKKKLFFRALFLRY